MWVKPWNMKEGFLIGGGLLVTGLLLQVVLGPIEWRLLAWPVNLILLILFLATIGVLFSLRRKVYAFEWMMHAGAAVPCLVYAAALTITNVILIPTYFGTRRLLCGGIMQVMAQGSAVFLTALFAFGLFRAAGCSATVRKICPKVAYIAESGDTLGPVDYMIAP